MKWNEIMKNKEQKDNKKLLDGEGKKMGKKVNFIEGKLIRKIGEYTYSDFYSQHNQEDIQGWLEGVYEYELQDSSNQYDFEWDYDDSHVEVEKWSMNEEDLKTEQEYEHDDEIQEWIDGKPQREKELEEYRKKNNKFYEQRDEIEKKLKKKDYVLTVYQTGDEGMSMGNHERKVFPRRYYVVCSLEEIPDYIKSMKRSFWEVPDGLSEEEIENYPYEKKKWGINWNVVIEPLSEEMEKDYVGSSKMGFFKSWREIHKSDMEKEKGY